MNYIEANALTKQFGKLTAVDTLPYLTILRLMSKEEFRLPASIFNHSYFLASSPVLVLILFQFAVAVVSVLVAQTFLSLYYQINNSIATLCISGPDILLVAASKIMLGQLDTW